MRPWDSRRPLVFAVALSTLAVGAAVLSQLGPHDEGGGGTQSRPGDAGGRVDRLAHPRSAPPSGAEIAARRFGQRIRGRADARIRAGENESFVGPATSGVPRVVERFVRAYLRYEVGALSVADRVALSRSSTARLSGELLSAPVRIPAGLRPPVERFVRLGALRPAASGGALGISAAVVVRQNGRPEVLGVSLVHRGGRWLVSEIGR